MSLRQFALFAAALALAVPLSSQTQPAVEPGGDIPSKFHPATPPPGLQRCSASRRAPTTNMPGAKSRSRCATASGCTPS